MAQNENVQDDISQFSGQSAGSLIASGDTMRQINTGFATAVSVQRPRDLERFRNNLMAEAKIAGKKFYYHWEVFDKEKGRKVPIEGTSIGLAMAAARNYGNCAVIPETVVETPTSYIFKSYFVDLETGYTYGRQFRMSKKFPVHGKMDDNRKEDIRFQIGQSKCDRNVVDKVLNGTGILDQAIETAKKSEREAIEKAIEKAGGDISAVIDKMLAYLLKFDIDQKRVENSYGIERDSWTIDTLVMLAGDMQALKDRTETADTLFPIEKEEEQKTTKPDKPIPGFDDEKTATPGNKADHQGFEPITEKATPEFRKLFAEDKDDLILTFQIELENAFPKKEDIATFWKSLITNNIVSKADETSINKQELVNAILTLRKNSNGNDQKKEVKKEPEPEPQKQKETPESIKAKRIQNLTDNKSREDLLKQATEDLNNVFKNEDDATAFLQSLVDKKILRAADLTLCHKGHLAHVIVAITDHTLNKKDNSTGNGNTKQKRDNDSAQTEADF